jgi:hypothetical protein
MGLLLKLSIVVLGVLDKRARFYFAQGRDPERATFTACILAVEKQESTSRCRLSTRKTQ